MGRNWKRAQPQGPAPRQLLTRQRDYQELKQEVATLKRRRGSAGPRISEFALDIDLEPSPATVLRSEIIGNRGTSQDGRDRTDTFFLAFEAISAKTNSFRREWLQQAASIIGAGCRSAL